MSDYISRADAIEAVRKELVCDGRHETHDKTCRFIADVLLSALPSAELPKGDLISRADVLKYPIRLDHYDEVNGSREFVYGVESVIEYVEALPSADIIEFDFTKHQPRVRNKVNDSLPSADRPSGEWLEIEDYNGDYYYQCSVCKEDFYIEYGTPKENGYAYCPSCGAFMKGGAE